MNEGTATPPEKLLQTIWQQQRLLRERLITLDGQPVRVLHPGFRNHGAGPDFRSAIIQIGNGETLTGEIELDLSSNGWRAHGHDKNPNFRNVILHVIWDGGQPVKGIPTVSLKEVLDAPLAELELYLGQEAVELLPENYRGQCCVPLRELSAEKMQELLHQSAMVRFQAKAAYFQARARQVGWEQTLWEGLFRALGYKQNVWPMQLIGEFRSRWQMSNPDVKAVQARLLGVAGLLPVELPKASSSGSYLKRIWDQWWRERDEFESIVLPRELWKFQAMRPANHPQRRLALAAHWVAGDNLVSKLEGWFTTSIPDKQLADSLWKLLSVKDDFWDWHWTFRSARLPKPQPLLGAARVTDLAVNVILPWLWTRAVEGGNKTLQETARQRYLAWPAAEDNTLLKLARKRLLGAGGASCLRSAASQQGLLQIVRDYCDHSNAICEECRFPELVRSWKLNS